MSIVNTAHYRPQPSGTIFRNLLSQRRRWIWPPLIEQARRAGSAVQRNQPSPRQSFWVARPLPVTAWQTRKVGRVLLTVFTFLSDAFPTRAFHKIARAIFTQFHTGRPGRPFNTIVYTAGVDRLPTILTPTLTPSSVRSGLNINSFSCIAHLQSIFIFKTCQDIARSLS
ncbi:hypothetical protein ARMSODRAFT_685369 [Armillaria solidipes]|uniref:Uncharacterized protein n=1 Tax=Armillaria solidipes TaxID=1076256 RepID=A0A2H3APE3_9AGAR|nr:hypothetical protein ARMSODRAFT_685369 [Armillaria solidipes]